MDYDKIIKDVVSVLKRIDGVSCLVLFGSVAKGTARPDSDIDLALILDDLMKTVGLDMEGIPLGLRQQVDLSVNGIAQSYGVKLHIPIHYESEYRKGMGLRSFKPIVKY